MSQNKLTEYCFLIFLFLLPFQTVFLLREPFIDGEKWQYGTIGIYAVDILLLFLLVMWSAGRCSEWRTRIPDILSQKTVVLLALFVLWAGLSVFWATDSLLAFSFFLKLLLAAGLFLFLRSWNELSLRKVVFVLLAAGVLQSGIGITQFLTQETASSVIFGMSSHEASQAGSSVLKLDSGRFLRAYGTFSHPNELGVFLGAILVLSVGWSVFAVRNRAASLFMIFGELIVLLGLILTFSRAAWLGAGMGIFVLAVYLYRQLQCQNESFPCESKCNIIPRPWNYVTFFKTYVVLGIAMIVFVIVLREQVFPRFDTKIIAHEGSVSERIASLEDGQRLIEAQPIIGVGAGNFTAEIMQLQPERPVWNIQPAHNVFMLVWSELGLIGLVLFLAFLFQIVKRSNENAIFSIALLTLVPSLFLDHLLWSSHFGILFLFLLLGLAAHREKSDNLMSNH